jgi:hypothetical protein
LVASPRPRCPGGGGAAGVPLPLPTGALCPRCGARPRRAREGEGVGPGGPGHCPRLQFSRGGGNGPPSIARYCSIGGLAFNPPPPPPPCVPRGASWVPCAAGRRVKKTPTTSCALRDQRGQGPRIWPPLAPWVQGGAGMGWMRSGGSNVAHGPVGSVAGGPRPPGGAAGSSAPLLPRAGGRLRLPAGLRPRVSSTHSNRPGPQLQVQDSIMRPRPVVGIAYIQIGPACFLHMLARSLLCRFRLALQRKSGPWIAIYEVLRDHTARAHAATAVLRDRLRFCMCVRPRALWLECERVRSAGQSRRKKRPPPIPTESHVAVCMPVARKEAI